MIPIPRLLHIPDAPPTSGILYEEVKVWRDLINAAPGIYEVDVDAFLHRDYWKAEPNKSLMVVVYPTIDFGLGCYLHFENYRNFLDFCHNFEEHKRIGHMIDKMILCIWANYLYENRPKWAAKHCMRGVE